MKMFEEKKSKGFFEELRQNGLVHLPQCLLPTCTDCLYWVGGGHSAHPSLAAQQVKVAKTTGKLQVFNQSNLLLNGQLYKTESF